MPHVVCVGDLMVDIVARVPGPLRAGSDTPAPIEFRGGGAAANVAAWLATTGTRTAFVGRVGADAAGRAAVDELSAGGVTPAVTVDPVRPTGACIVLVDPDGERTMIPHAGANSGLGEVDAAVALPTEADLLYVSGYALLNTGSRPFALHALRLARERGWQIAVDAASAGPLADVGAAAFVRWIGTGLLLLANADEARALTGGQDGHAAARALASVVGESVVKDGATGAVWCGGRGVEQVPARVVPPEAHEGVLDTTGAGDAFAAGFLHARLDGRTVPDCLEAGCVLAARALTVCGARPRS